MPIEVWILLVLFFPWATKGPDGKSSHPFGFVHLGVFLWGRLTETDAEKAQRLITRSQQLLEQAQKLIAAMVDNEFEKRLRIVSGDKERTD